MSLAKAVANAAAMLVLKAKNVAQVAEDTVLQNRVIAAATQCALSTSQLVACAKVSQLAPRALSCKCHVLWSASSHWGRTQAEFFLNCLRFRACFRCCLLDGTVRLWHELPHCAFIICSLPKSLGRGPCLCLMAISACRSPCLPFGLLNVSCTQRVLALYRSVVEHCEWVRR